MGSQLATQTIHIKDEIFWSRWSSFNLHNEVGSHIADQNREHTTIYLIMYFSADFSVILPVCGTSFLQVPYNVDADRKMETSVL